MTTRRVYPSILNNIPLSKNTSPDQCMVFNSEIPLDTLCGLHDIHLITTVFVLGSNIVHGNDRWNDLPETS